MHRYGGRALLDIYRAVILNFNIMHGGSDGCNPTLDATSGINQAECISRFTLLYVLPSFVVSSVPF